MMRLKEYMSIVGVMLYEDYINNNVSYASDIFSYLMEMKINRTDSSIRKISSLKYEFDVNKTTYTFNIEHLEILPGDYIYTVYFHPKDTMSFDRLDKHTMVQVRTVFQKVITCILMFISDINPDVFTFTGHDYKLYKTYNLIITRIRKDRLFSKYIISTDGRGFTFTKR